MKRFVARIVMALVTLIILPVMPLIWGLNWAMENVDTDFFDRLIGEVSSTEDKADGE